MNPGSLWIMGEGKPLDVWLLALGIFVVLSVIFVLAHWALNAIEAWRRRG